VSYQECDALSIDDVRTLSLRALQKPVALDVMTFIIDANSINVEAQHALLKLTEDPPASARFIFVLPLSAPILPTLRSRFTIIDVDSAPTDAAPHDDSIAKTLKDIARMAKDGDEAGMERMLRAAERHVHENPGSRAAEALMLVRRYIETRGSSPKMLLEHLVIAERE
jgi:DNA polymerase III delta prime subunit